MVVDPVQTQHPFFFFDNPYQTYAHHLKRLHTTIQLAKIQITLG